MQSSSSLQLRSQARWIRDDLDPQVARDGPDALQSDAILNLDEFLRGLFDSNLSIEDLRSSHIHLAIIQLASSATRWPSKIIDKCCQLIELWEKKYGSSLRDLRPTLCEPGGRLHGICTPQDLALSRSQLLEKWQTSINVGPLPTMSHGSLGFTPGDWWINNVFAYRGGIIDRSAGIVYDLDGVYAIVLTADDEDEELTSGPEKFVYRARNDDRGRYRLTSALPASRNPIRILRSHKLRSEWRPRAGLRYEGLYMVVGWSIGKDQAARSDEVVYKVELKRLSSEIDMESVLQRPWSDEMDDYLEWKRLRSHRQGG